MDGASGAGNRMDADETGRVRADAEPAAAPAAELAGALAAHVQSIERVYDVLAGAYSREAIGERLAQALADEQTVAELAERHSGGGGMCVLSAMFPQLAEGRLRFALDACNGDANAAADRIFTGHFANGTHAAAASGYPSSSPSAKRPRVVTIDIGSDSDEQTASRSDGAPVAVLRRRRSQSESDAAALLAPVQLSWRGYIDAGANEHDVAAMSREQRQLVGRSLHIFPDADPNWIVRRLLDTADSTGVTFDQLVEEMLGGGYDKIGGVLERKKREKRRLAYLDSARFDIDDYLKQHGPDPGNKFTEDSEPPTDIYTQHLQAYLCGEYTELRPTWLREFVKHAAGGRLLPICIMLQPQRQTIKRGRRPKFHVTDGAAQKKLEKMPAIYQRGRPAVNGPSTWAAGGAQSPTDEKRIEWPDTLDPRFFAELQYVVHREHIEEHRACVASARALRVQSARERDSGTALYECTVCADDEVLLEDMCRCSGDGAHVFCANCVAEHAKTRVKEGAASVCCMSAGCNGEYLPSVLASLLCADDMETLSRIAAQNAVNACDMADMFHCPFCPYAAVPHPNDRLFTCQACGKQTCRECGEPNHIPLRCDEVEKDYETQMRTYVEEKMAEALIRQCPRCKKRTVKMSGCNHMTCPCGAHFCYVCRKEFADPQSTYAHMGRGGCATHTTIDQVHADVVERAGREARQEFIADNVHLGGVLRERGLRDADITNMVDRQGQANAANVPPALAQVLQQANAAAQRAAAAAQQIRRDMPPVQPMVDGRQQPDVDDVAAAVAVGQRGRVHLEATREQLRRVEAQLAAVRRGGLGGQLLAAAAAAEQRVMEALARLPQVELNVELALQRATERLRALRQQQQQPPRNG